MNDTKKMQLTGVLIAGMVFLSCIYALHGSLLTHTIDFYGLTDSSQGMPSAAASAGGFLALISSLFLSGRLSKLSLLKCSIAICAVFLLVLPWTGSFAVFVGLWLGIGIGLGYLDTLLSSCMSDLYSGKTARRMMCLLHLTYGLASVTGPVVYSALLKQLLNSGFPWNRIYFFVAGAGFILLLVLLWVTRKMVQQEGGVASLERRLSIELIKELLQIRNGILWKMMMAMLFHGIFMSGISTWINRYVEVSLKAEYGAYALSFFFFGVMLSRLIMSFLQISTEKYLSVSGVLAGGVMLLALPTGMASVTCAALSLCGLFFGAMIPCILSLVSSHAPENPMLVTTSMMLAFYLGQAVGPTMTGVLEGSFGLKTGICVCAVFIMLASVCCRMARIKDKE